MNSPIPPNQDNTPRTTTSKRWLLHALPGGSFANRMLSVHFETPSIQRALIIVRWIITVIAILVAATFVYAFVWAAAFAEDKGPAGMIVFSLAFLLPVAGVIITGCLSVIPLIVGLSALSKRGQKLHPKESWFLVCLAIFVVISIAIAIVQLPNLLPSA